MSNGDTTNLGTPRLSMSSAGPRFSVIDMGAMVGPERMNTMGMLKSELRSVYEDNTMVRGLHRAVADPGEAIIALLKPLMILVAVVIGFVGAALLMESRASATSAAEVQVQAIQPIALEPEPVLAAALEPAEEQPADEEVAVEAATEPEPEPAVTAAEPTRKARIANKRAKRKKHKKRSKKRNRRRRR